MSDAVGRLRQLGDNATEGPWEADGWSVYTSAGALVANAEVEDWRDATSDAEFIAAARNVWDALLDVARVARAVELNDWATLLEVGGPVRHRGDLCDTPESFATEGDFEADARYVHPAREKLRSQALRAALDRLDKEAP